MIQLNELTLRDFRCFAECTIQFDPSLTVLVARKRRAAPSRHSFCRP